MQRAVTFLTGALALFTSVLLPAPAQAYGDPIGNYNFLLEVEGEPAGGFVELAELDGHGGDVLALQDGVVSEELLLAVAEAEKRPLALTLQELDEKGRVIGREKLCATPLTMVLDDPKAGPVALSTPDEIEEAATLSPDDEHGIMIWIIYVGSCEDEE
jgi:hypothetical protein